MWVCMQNWYTPTKTHTKAGSEENLTSWLIQRQSRGENVVAWYCQTKQYVTDKNVYTDSM